jgi:hypothetical protein
MEVEVEAGDDKMYASYGYSSQDDSPGSWQWLDVHIRF